MRRSFLAIPVLLLLLAPLAASLPAIEPAAPRAPATAPAPFMVGAGVRDITPATPQYLGGYGTDRVSAGVNDPLQVRAFSVTNRSGATVMWAEVDTQGYFSGYQEGPYGTLDVRESVERDIGVPQGHVIVASSHSHAAPTIMGIWGPTDVAYLRMVHDQTVATLEAAYAAREPASLWVATGHYADMIGTNVSYGDMMVGWPVDDQLSVLRAVSPEGRDVATFINFGVHADIVASPRISADWLGAARDYVQARLGGVVVVAEGTLGHQEAPIEDNRGGDPYDQIVRFGNLLGERALDRIADGSRSVVGDAVDGDMEYFAIPITNPALLALVLGANPHDTPGVNQAVDNYPIDRSFLPPFALPPVGATWAGAVRFGDELLFTLPGEAFSDVPATISAATTGCHADFKLGLANEQFGYYWMAWETPNAVPVGDFLQFNVNPALGDVVANVDTLAANKIGCAASPATSQPQNRGTGSITGANPFGAQALAFPDQTDVGSDVTFEGFAFQGSDALAWDFGDGTTATGARVLHAFATAGTHHVVMTSTSTSGALAHVEMDVRVWPHAGAAATTEDLGGHTARLSAEITGASGRPLQATWSIGGQATTGLVTTHTFPSAGTYVYHVSVADASGLVGEGDFPVTLG